MNPVRERIQEIRFLNFRGLPDYSCSLKGKNLVVFGGNGKGKSAIVDGIEFFFSGRVRRFHGEGTGFIDSREAIQHVLKRGEPLVELLFTPTNDSCRRGFDAGISESPKISIRSYLEAHPPAEAFILRRSQILEFVCDQDATRYQKYIRLLGLAEIDDMQRRFVEAKELASNQYQTWRNRRNELLAQFTDPASRSPPVNLASVLAQCSASVKGLGLAELKDWSHLEAALLDLEKKRSAETKAKVDSLNKAIECLGSDLPVGADATISTVNQVHTSLLGLKSASDEAARGSVIREGLAYFEEQPDLTQCPLCEQTLVEGYAATYERLKQRSATLILLRELEAKRSQALGHLVRQTQQTADQLARDRLQASHFTEVERLAFRRSGAELLQWLRLVKRINSKTALEQIIRPGALDEILEFRKAIVTKLIVRRDALVPPESAKLEGTIALLNKAKNAEPGIREAEKITASAGSVLSAAQQAENAFFQARERSIQQIFGQIADKVLDYYKKLHESAGEDGEQSECTKLSLTPTSRAAAGGLRLAINFLGRAALCDPRAFLSEGHVDSLGLCLYLATVRIFNPPGTLLVLDDILTSIDKEHRFRVAELLFEEFSDFQLVLTTHDEHWFGILQKSAQARGVQGNWAFKRIARWTVDRGPEAATFERTWNYISANLKAETFRELGGPLRLVFEDFLKRVAEKVELRVRYRFDGKYTSGDFVVAGIDGAIRKELLSKTPAEETAIKQELARVFGTGDIINFLSHDNPGRFEVSFEQVTDFVNSLKSLIKRCRDNQIMKGVGG